MTDKGIPEEGLYLMSGCPYQASLYDHEYKKELVKESFGDGYGDRLEDVLVWRCWRCGSIIEYKPEID